MSQDKPQNKPQDKHQNQYLPQQEQKSNYVHSMFGSIAHRYDLMNDIMTFGLHRFWKKEVCELLNVKPEDTVVDLCCGTGDLTSMLVDFYPRNKVVGLDFSPQMLEFAEQRTMAKVGLQTKNIQFIQGDALELPFDNESVGGVSISFGLRNVADYQKCLQEVFRVSKYESNFVILDLSHPSGFWDLASRFYRFNVVPIIGKLIVDNKAAYDYLPNSIDTYPNQENLAEMLREAGWKNVEYKNIFGGVSAIHVARKMS